MHEENDSLVWLTASTFCSLFNKADVNAMSNFLPDDFLLQWMHENFIGKKNLLNAMTDSSAHKAMEHNIVRNNSAMIKYSDDQTAASVKTVFEFLDTSEKDLIQKQQGFGLCILYLKKQNSKWVLKTVHLDLHCALCNF